MVQNRDSRTHLCAGYATGSDAVARRLAGAASLDCGWRLSRRKEMFLLSGARPANAQPCCGDRVCRDLWYGIGRAAHLAQRDCTPIDGSWRAGINRYLLVVGPCRPGLGVSKRHLVRALYNARVPCWGGARYRVPGSGNGDCVRDRAAGRFCAGILGSRCTGFVIGGDWCWGLLVGFFFICDQLAMARLPLASFVMMLALLPATATLIGKMVLD